MKKRLAKILFGGRFIEPLQLLLFWEFSFLVELLRLV
jgi:hypothetical protein